MKGWVKVEELQEKARRWKGNDFMKECREVEGERRTTDEAIPVSGELDRQRWLVCGDYSNNTKGTPMSPALLIFLFTGLYNSFLEFGVRLLPLSLSPHKSQLTVGWSAIQPIVTPSLRACCVCAPGRTAVELYCCCCSCQSFTALHM